TPAPIEIPTSFDGRITVTVPSDAKIFVNGHRTTSTGEFRQYVSRNLRGSAGYTYQIRAEMEVDGQVVQDTREVSLRAGQIKHVSFSLDTPQRVATEEPARAAEASDTTLTLRVPADARVYLGGNPTAAVGNVRTFTTAGLAAGQKWDNYKIVVAVERNGQMLTQERVITLQAGDQPSLDFDFDTAKVADAR
ncbi:MAG: hypothetical protein ACI9G1_003629, partial [Pirellulaceae bacterium]